MTQILSAKVDRIPAGSAALMNSTGSPRRFAGNLKTGGSGRRSRRRVLNQGQGAERGFKRLEADKS
jgi:hypothetical protein